MLIRIRTVIVGSKYRDGAAEQLAKLGQGAPLDLVHEPNHPHDPSGLAVAVYSEGVHLGYIPTSCPERGLIAEWLGADYDLDAEIELEAIVDGARIIAAPKIVISWEDDDAR